MIMKQCLLFSVLLVLLRISVSDAQHKSPHPKHKKQLMSTTKDITVPFVEANHYFIKNTYQEGDLNHPKITSLLEFERFVGYAPVMGDDGLPTAIDFNKQYVLLVPGHETDKLTTMRPISLTQHDKVITLTYEYHEGAKQTYRMLPFLLLIVDNQYQGEIKLVKVASGKGH